MATEWTNPAACNCLALRQAARHVSQFYDQFLAPHGLRTTQYSILARLQRRGTMSINLLAAETTLGRNILPLQREGLISISPGRVDRRSKELRLTKAGAERCRAALKGWRQAQAQFEAAFGRKCAETLRALLHDVATNDEITVAA
jgi:DNA-binding MarR family transcriptional regulator